MMTDSSTSSPCACERCSLTAKELKQQPIQGPQTMLPVHLSVLEGEEELQREVFELAGMRQSSERAQERLQAWLEVSALNAIVCKKGPSLVSQSNAAGRALLQLAKRGKRMEVAKYIESFEEPEAGHQQDQDSMSDPATTRPLSRSGESLGPLSFQLSFAESPLQFAVRVAERLPERRTQKLKWSSTEYDDANDFASEEALCEAGDEEACCDVSYEPSTCTTRRASEAITALTGLSSYHNSQQDLFGREYSRTSSAEKGGRPGMARSLTGFLKRSMQQVRQKVSL